MKAQCQFQVEDILNTSFYKELKKINSNLLDRLKSCKRKTIHAEIIPIFRNSTIYFLFQ